MKSEDLSAQVDGVEDTFTVGEDFTASSLRCYYNGLRMTAQVTVLTANTFQLSIVPTNGTKLEVDYTAA